MNLFKVVHDGPSRPMIETPQGRLLSISQFEDGRWNSYDKEESDCKAIVNGLNWLMTNADKLAELSAIMDLVDKDEILQPQ